LRLLLDASFLLALRRGEDGARRMLDERKNTADEVGVSRLTEYEIRVGAQHLWKKYGDARELAWIEGLFEWLTVYEVDAGVIGEASELQAGALGRGRRSPTWTYSSLSREGQVPSFSPWTKTTSSSS
jgi:predicted nucleic acid-binding protein